jgi:C1A family cysteine protease
MTPSRFAARGRPPAWPLALSVLPLLALAAAPAPAGPPQVQNPARELSADAAAETLGIPVEELARLRAERLNKDTQLDARGLEEFREQFGFVANGLPTFQIEPGVYYVLMSARDIKQRVPDGFRVGPGLMPYPERPKGDPAPVKKDDGKTAGKPARPPKVDHRAARPGLTPVRDQGLRGTCVAFAACAELEALLARAGRPDPDLSENHAYAGFMTEERSTPCDDPGLATVNAPAHLTRHLVCAEAGWPYVPDDPADLRRDGKCGKINDTPAAVAGADGWGVETARVLGRADIRNTDLLEQLLADGRNVVFGTLVAWRTADMAGLIDVRFGPSGQPIYAEAGHAMLLAGYDRTGKTPFFIVKNSWGTKRGHAGYLHVSYDYLRTYGKYGYVTTKMRTGKVTPPKGKE